MVCASLNYHNSDKHKWNFLFLTLGLWQQSENGAFTGEFFYQNGRGRKVVGIKITQLHFYVFITLKSDKATSFTDSQK